MARRWALLAGYTALIYTTLPYGAGVGRAALRSSIGAWVFGPGLVIAAATLVVWLVVLLRRNRAGARAYVLLALTGAGWAGALVWLRTVRLERIHVPEYGIAAWLAWRAVRPIVSGSTASYAAAAAIAAVIGWGEEEMQRFVPGRVYDPRDIVANALGAILGVLLLATLREGMSRRSPDARDTVTVGGPVDDRRAAGVDLAADRPDRRDVRSV